MKNQAIQHPAMALHGPARPGVERALRFVVDRFLLLPIGALIALLWANVVPESYFQFSHTLSFAVNEIAMAIFLALLAQEVLEALMPGGALHTWRRWGLPLIAAAGGVAGAAAVYLLYVSANYETVLSRAWPIACAIDVAAAYYVLKTIWQRSSALPFLLLLALVTDGFGLVFVALRDHGLAVRPDAALFMAAAVVLASVMRLRNVRAFWAYFAVCGTLSWIAFYLEGIHPALALIPIVPFLPREPRPLDLFANPKDDDEVHHYEHEWNEVVQVVLFFFGLVNAGVMLRGYDTGTEAIVLAAVIGRPLGILAAVALAVVLGFRLPHRLGWRELAVVALATSSGFTFALFFATSLLPVGPVLAQVKLGALLTVIAALIAMGAARLLRVGRFARP